MLARMTGLPSGPVDLWDRVRNRIELIGTQSDPPAPASNPRPLATVLREAGDALGHDLARLTEDSELEDLRRATRAAAPFEKVYDASDALAQLCYVLCSALAPNAAVETGVANGVTSAHLLAGLGANGRLYSIDWSPGGSRRRRPIGSLVPQALRGAWQLEIGPSRRLLPRIGRRVAPIGVFVHDSLHTYRTMRTELEVVTPYMDRPGAILVDDVSLNAAFSDWSNATRPDYVALVATELEDHPIGVALLL